MRARTQDPAISVATRGRLARFEFRYDLNVRKPHVGGVLDGTRARELLGFVPRNHVTWLRPWWRVLLDRLAANRDVAER